MSRLETKPDGSSVTDEEFQTFIDREVSPRFPTGFPVAPGDGRFRDAGGNFVRETSRVVIILPTRGRIEDDAIEQLRAFYRSAFWQESVLRVDEEACVSF